MQDKFSSAWWPKRLLTAFARPVSCCRSVASSLPDQGSAVADSALQAFALPEFVSAEKLACFKVPAATSNSFTVGATKQVASLHPQKPREAAGVSRRCCLAVFVCKQWWP